MTEIYIQYILAIQGIDDNLRDKMKKHLEMENPKSYSKWVSHLPD